MELSVVYKDEKKHSATDKLVDKPQTGATHLPPRVESTARATPSRFDPDAQITDSMKWRPTDRPAMQKHHGQIPGAGPTWGHLFGQILIRMIEILIPLAFIVGMIYLRAPWLFWAVVHFLRGEPVFRF
jgi:hypothetical protein